MRCTIGRRGPKPQPPARNAIAGNPGKRPEPPPIVTAPPGRPQPPDWLSAGAKAVWAATVPQLEAMGVLSVVDADVIAAYCVAVVEVRLATEMLEAEGRYVDGSRGLLVAHPANALQRSALRALATYSGLLGLNPAARQRLALPPEEQPDEMDQFLKGAMQ